MKLSILIPTFNTRCIDLCREMSRALREAAVDGEIIVVDDCSTLVSVRQDNQRINEIDHARIIYLDVNMGVAKVRNRLAAEATGDMFLFLDADVFPVYVDFLKRYEQMIGMADVICGGLRYRLDGPTKVSPLRYAYGMKYEIRQSHFLSSNFFISADTFREISFDETYSTYGHEDTQFGAELLRRGFTMAHVDNPVYHDDNDTSEHFVAKTRTAIDNLVRHREMLRESSRLLQMYERLSWIPMGWMMRMLYASQHERMERNLLSDNPSLTVLNIYKLSYLYTAMYKAQ